MLRVAVATSGGRDSTALLHATVQAMRACGGEVLALHVHHGLQAAADVWLEHVRKQARRWGAGFDSRRLSGAPAPGESVEAWARKGRYAALAEMAKAGGCELVLLAHHRRDQAETWLLQALRGGSAAALSAMPAVAHRAGLCWARPWLQQPREAIEAYVRRHRIKHIDDDSNADARYARNRLRLQVWPALTLAFPDAEAALVAAATHAQGAAALADEVLALDLPSVTHEAGLQVAAWLELPPARRRNALRGWLVQQLGRGAPDALIERLSAELPRGHAARWEAPGCELRLYRGLLQAAASAEPAARPPDATTLRLDRPGVYAVPSWQGTLTVTHGGASAASPALLAEVQLRARAGGERFRLAPGATARSLKKQYQARSVAAWQRGGPLLFGADGRLLFVPGLGLDGAALAAPGEQGLHIVWTPDSADTKEQRQTSS